MQTVPAQAASSCKKMKKKTPELDNLEKWLEIQSGIV